MTDNVVKFYHKNADKEPDAVLEQAIGEYEDVLILGWDKDESFDPRCSTNLKAKDLLWLVSLFQHKLMAGDYNDEGDDGRVLLPSEIFGDIDPNSNEISRLLAEERRESDGDEWYY